MRKDVANNLTKRGDADTLRDKYRMRVVVRKYEVAFHFEDLNAISRIHLGERLFVQALRPDVRGKRYVVISRHRGKRKFTYAALVEVVEAPVCVLSGVV